MNLNKKSIVFYVPGSAAIIDLAVKVGEAFVSRAHRLGLVELAKEFPDVKIGSLDDVTKDLENSFKTPVSEISPDKFQEMLCVAPPDDWKYYNNFEYFKLEEHTSGPVTGIFVRLGALHYTFQDDFALSEGEIHARIIAFQKEKATAELQSA